MPYKLSEDKLSVLKEDGTLVKKHNTVQEAKDHLAALEMNVEEAKKGLSKKQMDDMMAMGGSEYARQEAWDVSTAASILSQVAMMVMNEADEPGDVKSLTAIIRSLMEFIEGELKEMEKASRRGNNYEKSVPAQVKQHDYFIEDKSNGGNLDLSYIKKIGIETLSKSLAAKYVGKNVIAHPVFIWGSPSVTDLDVEFFKRDSDFWDAALKGYQRPLTWDHAQDEKFNHFEVNPVIGKTVSYYDDEIARWAESVIETDKKYRKYVDQFIEEKRLGYSSDTAPQYVIREQQGKAIWLKQWPWFGGALTVSPCEPRMKTLYTPEFLKSIGIVLPDAGNSLRLDSLKRQSTILQLKGKGL